MAVIFPTLYCESLHSFSNYYFSETIFDVVLERAFLAAQMVKNLPAMQETWVRSLGQEWLLTLVFLHRESQGQRSLVGYSPWGCKESYTVEQLTP